MVFFQPLCYREYLQVQHSCSPPSNVTLNVSLKVIISVTWESPWDWNFFWRGGVVLKLDATSLSSLFTFSSLSYKLKGSSWKAIAEGFGALASAPDWGNVGLAWLRFGLVSDGVFGKPLCFLAMCSVRPLALECLFPHMCNLVLASKYENDHMIITISCRQMRARKIILNLISKTSREWEWDFKSNPITELHSRQLETKLYDFWKKKNRSWW